MVTIIDIRETHDTFKTSHKLDPITGKWRKYLSDWSSGDITQHTIIKIAPNIIYVTYYIENQHLEQFIGMFKGEWTIE